MGSLFPKLVEQPKHIVRQRGVLAEPTALLQHIEPSAQLAIKLPYQTEVSCNVRGPNVWDVRVPSLTGSGMSAGARASPRWIDGRHRPTRSNYRTLSLGKPSTAAEGGGAGNEEATAVDHP